MHNKSYAFARRIINMVKYIDCPYKMVSLTNQIFRSGTAVGALVREAEFAQSPSDFINKLHIALKECNETIYWLNLLHDTNFIDEKEYGRTEEGRTLIHDLFFVAGRVGD